MLTRVQSMSIEMIGSTPLHRTAAGPSPASQSLRPATTRTASPPARTPPYRLPQLRNPPQCWLALQRRRHPWPPTPHTTAMLPHLTTSFWGPSRSPLRLLYDLNGVLLCSRWIHLQGIGCVSKHILQKDVASWQVAWPACAVPELLQLLFGFLVLVGTARCLDVLAGECVARGCLRWLLQRRRGSGC